jgi:hypothetical protein
LALMAGTLPLAAWRSRPHPFIFRPDMFGHLVTGDRTMLEPAVYLVAVFSYWRASLAPRDSYFSEAVHDQIDEAGDQVVARGRRGRGRPVTLVDPSVFKPDLDAHPWGSIPEQPGSQHGAMRLTWWPILASPVFFGEWGVSTHSFSGAPVFTAAAHGDRCLLRWQSTSQRSPFPGGASHVELVHGAAFDSARCHYVVWVEPKRTWSDNEPATPSDSQILDELRTLGHTALEHGSKRFLALPRVSRWWGKEFMRLTGFTPYRPHGVPFAQWSGTGVVDGGFELRWMVVGGWRDAGFFRTLRGADLVALRDCATILHDLRVMPELGRYQYTLPSVQEIEAELAFLQVERERLDDHIKRNQLKSRMRELGGMLSQARERAASEAAEAARIEAAGSRERPLTAWERVQRSWEYDPMPRPPFGY